MNYSEKSTSSTHYKYYTLYNGEVIIREPLINFLQSPLREMYSSEQGCWVFMYHGISSYKTIIDKDEIEKLITLKELEA